MKIINPATSKRRTTLILIAIAFLLLSAIVYAALSGILTISGTTTTTGNTDVIFTNVTNTAVVSSSFNKVEPDFEVSDDGHTITFSADLTEPGQSSGLDYTIENIGSTNATIYAPTLTYDAERIDRHHVTGKIRFVERLSIVAETVTSQPQYTLSHYAEAFGLTEDQVIEEETTDDYITIVPGASITPNFGCRFEWNANNTALSPGEYEVTMTLNFQAAT